MPTPETTPEPSAEKTDPGLPPDTPWWARIAITEWREFVTWTNTYLIGALTALPGAYELLPQKYQAMIPTTWLHWIEAAIGFVTFVNLLRKKGTK